jgi:hypothetical protein
MMVEARAVKMAEITTYIRFCEVASISAPAGADRPALPAVCKEEDPKEGADTCLQIRHEEIQPFECPDAGFFVWRIVHFTVTYICKGRMAG